MLCMFALLNQEKYKTEQKLMVVSHFREGGIRYRMSMCFINVSTGSPGKNFHVVVIRFLNVVFRSLSGEKN